MTTYTLTEEQWQQLLLAIEWSLPHDDAALAHEVSLVMLQSLTPHSGEVAAPSTSAVYIRRDQYAKAQTAPYLCEVGPEPREDRMPLYATPQAAPSASQDAQAQRVVELEETVSIAQECTVSKCAEIYTLRAELAALRAAPSTSQPLTKEQARVALGLQKLPTLCVMRDVRAIEAAHNIKGGA